MTAIDLSRLLVDLGLVVLAFLLALPVGWDRYQKDRPAGLRTFPIVALASCAFILVARGAFEESPEAQARAIQGLMTGIGFIGGGAILKGFESVEGSGEAQPRSHVTGIATAASIWNTGAIGAAVGFERFEIAAVLSLTNFLILWLLEPGKVEEGVEKVEDGIEKMEDGVEKVRDGVTSDGDDDGETSGDDEGKTPKEETR